MGLSHHAANQPARDFPCKIAITIAIENRSGKITIRFSFFDRSAFFPEKTLRDFFVKNGSRLKQPLAGAGADVERAGTCVHKWLTFHKRIAIFL